MQDLNFRKKRKNTSGNTRRRKWGSKGRGLRFESEKNGLRFVKDRASGKGVHVREIILWAVEILIVCMTAVLLIAAFGQRVSMAGDSMAPVLRNGNVVLVNHFIYNMKNPARGDIVVYRQSGDSRYSIKRVAGLPGETVQIADGELLINGEDMTEEIPVSDLSYAGLAQEPVELGEEEYFVIGDNSLASEDSRTPGIGNIKKEEIYGPPWLIVSPLGDFGFVTAH